MQTLLEVVREIIVVVAAATTAVVAVLGLETWRLELRGRAEYDVARRLIRSLYGVLRGIQDVRHPFMEHAEFEDATEKRGETYEPLSSDSRYERFVYEERWKGIQNALVALYGDLAEAQVLWGWEFQDKVKPLRGTVTKLRYNLGLYLEGRDKQHKSGAEIEKFIETEKIVFSVSDDPDEDSFLGEVRAAILDIEGELRPHLKGERAWEGVSLKRAFRSMMARLVGSGEAQY